MLIVPACALARLGTIAVLGAPPRSACRVLSGTPVQERKIRRLRAAVVATGAPLAVPLGLYRCAMRDTGVRLRVQAPTPQISVVAYVLRAAAAFVLQAASHPQA